MDFLLPGLLPSAHFARRLPIFSSNTKSQSNIRTSFSPFRFRRRPRTWILCSAPLWMLSPATSKFFNGRSRTKSLLYLIENISPTLPVESSQSRLSRVTRLAFKRPHKTILMPPHLPGLGTSWLRLSPLGQGPPRQAAHRYRPTCPDFSR